MAQLNFALLVLDGDYHFFKVQQVFALQLLQLETNLFGLVGLIESDYSFGKFGIPPRSGDPWPDHTTAEVYAEG